MYQYNPGTNRHPIPACNTLVLNFIQGVQTETTMFLKVKAKSDDITTSLTWFTDFTVSSIADLVSSVASVCKPRMLQELVLYAHGADGAFSIGDERFGGISSPKDAEARLTQLSGLHQFFGGSVGRPRLILCVCEGGKNPANLLAMSKAIMQPVFGCTGDVRPTLGFGHGWWQGDIIMADPLSLTTGVVGKIPDPPILPS
ncbi:MAG: hypothetical protein ACRC14_03035 [Paracoccaceae bacterium]